MLKVLVGLRHSKRHCLSSGCRMEILSLHGITALVGSAGAKDINERLICSPLPPFPARSRIEAAAANN